MADQERQVGIDVIVARVPFRCHDLDSVPGSVGGQTRSGIVVNWLQGLDLAP